MGKTHWSIRALSLTLAICLLLGTVPAGTFTLPVFAADPTTSENVTDVRTYAQSLLDENFATASILEPASGQDFTWDKEGGKGDTWRYYNGLMVDALLMLGTDSNSGNVLQFADDFYNTNISEDGYIKRYGGGDIVNNELDSIQPARALFDLLDTAVDKTKYEAVLHNMYTELCSFTKYPNHGGNFQHKTDWTSYEIALDGIYMGLPFLVEYANAIDEGKISNTNGVSTETIYNEVCTRLDWIATGMDYQVTKDGKTVTLYHHGWNTTNGTGNGVTWLRAVGWYAAALVDIIGMLPESQSGNKQTLITHLQTLMDGMIAYQDASGLWYNVVYSQETSDKEWSNGDATYTGENRLETSGTALLSYALLKAYNNGWLGASYGKAGLKAFDGIVGNSTYFDTNGLKSIYKSSSVYTDPDAYCIVAKNENTDDRYVTGEGKGVGPLLMAAAEADRYVGGSETFKIGVVSAPENMVIAQGSTVLDTSNITATLVGSQGTIKNVSGTALTYEFDSSNTGKVTVTAKYNGNVIDTLDAKVVATSDAASAARTLVISSVDSDQTKPSFITNEQFVAVYEGKSDVYKIATHGTLTSSQEYLLVRYESSCGRSMGAVLDASGQAMVPMVAISGAGRDVSEEYTITASSGTLAYYKIDDQGRIFAQAENGDKYYLRFTDVDADDIELTKTETNASVFTFEQSTDNTYAFRLYTTINGKTAQLQIDDKGGNSKVSDTLYYVIFYTWQGGDPVYAQLSGSSGYSYQINTTSEDAILTEIRNGFEINISASADGSNPSILEWSDARVTWAWDNALDVTNGGDFNLIVKVDGVEIGRVPVNIYGGTVLTEYEVSATVSPASVSLNVNDSKTFEWEVYLAGEKIASPDILFTSSDETVCTFGTHNNQYYNKLQASATGISTVYMTVKGLSYNNNYYTLETPPVVAIPVVVNGGVTTDYAVAAVDSTASCIQVGGTANVSAVLTNGTNAISALVLSEAGKTIAWASSNPSVATVDSEGNVEAVGSGTVTITATVVDANAAVALLSVEEVASVEITVVAAAAEEDDSATETTTATEGTDNPSGYTHNFTDNGTSSGFYTISGNLSPSKGSVSYNGLTLTQCLKLETETEISFTAPSAGTLTLVFVETSTNIKLDGTKFTANSNVMTLDVTQGTHTLTKADTMNLFYMVYTPASDDHTHSYTSSVTTEATCTAAGVKTFTCSCGDSYTEAIAALGHTYSDVITAPTCTGQGYTTHTCATCSTSYVDTYVAAAGHSYSDSVTTAATCTTAGVRTYTCSVCGDSYTQSIAATGHSYSNGACTVCGVVVGDMPYEGVIISQGPVTVSTNEELAFDPMSSAISGGTFDHTIFESGGKFAVYYVGEEGLIRFYAQNSAWSWDNIPLEATEAVNGVEDGYVTYISYDDLVTNVDFTDGKYLAKLVVRSGYISEPMTVYYLTYIAPPKVTAAEVVNGSVSVEQNGSVTADLFSGVSLKLTYSDGRTETVENSELSFDLSGISTLDLGTVQVPFAYDGETYYATLTVKAYSGDTVTYYLDTNGVDAGEEYLIVAKVGESYYTMKNNGKDQYGSVYAVQPDSNGKLVLVPEGQQEVLEWTFSADADAAAQTVGGYSHSAYNIYGLLNYAKAYLNYADRLTGSERTQYVYHLGSGVYHIYANTTSGDYFGSWQYKSEKNYFGVRLNSAITEEATVYLYKAEPTNVKKVYTTGTVTTTKDGGQLTFHLHGTEAADAYGAFDNLKIINAQTGAVVAQHDFSSLTPSWKYAYTSGYSNVGADPEGVFADSCLIRAAGTEADLFFRYGDVPVGTYYAQFEAYGTDLTGTLSYELIGATVTPDTTTVIQGSQESAEEFTATINMSISADGAAGEASSDTITYIAGTQKEDLTSAIAKNVGESANIGVFWYHPSYNVSSHTVFNGSVQVITEAAHWIDCSDGKFAATYKDFPITEYVQTWTFTVKSLTDDQQTRQYYYNAIAQVLFGSNDTDFAASVRADYYAWEGTVVGNRINSSIGMPEGFVWTNWLNQNYSEDGVAGKITVQLVGGKVVVGICVNGLTGVYTVDADTTPILRITGQYCYLDDPTHIIDTSSSEHIDISAAVKAAGGSDATIAVDTKLVFVGDKLTLAPTSVTYEGTTYTSGYTVSYSIREGSEYLTLVDGVVTGVTPGVAIITATLESVTVDEKETEVIAVSCDFKVLVHEGWLDRTTNSEEAKAGDKLYFVYEGVMPGFSNQAPWYNFNRIYMSYLSLCKGDELVDGLGEDDFDSWDTSFSDWILVGKNGIGSASGAGQYYMVNGEYYSTEEKWGNILRFLRNTGAPCSAKYGIIVTEAGTYTYEYELLRPDSGNEGTMVGKLVVCKPVDVQNIAGHNVIEVPYGTTTIDAETVSDFLAENGMTVVYEDGTTETVYTNLRGDDGGSAIETGNGEDFITVYWDTGDYVLEAPIWVQYTVPDASTYIHYTNEHKVSSSFYSISSDGVRNDGRYVPVGYEYDHDNDPSTDDVLMDSGIKMGSAAFTTIAGPGKFVIVVGTNNSSTLVISDGTDEYTYAVPEKGQAYTFELDVEGGKTYTITRSGSEAGIFYMAYIPDSANNVYVADPEMMYIGINDTQLLDPTVVYDSKQLAGVNYTVSWSVADEDKGIVSVDADGNVTAVSGGIATVIATVTEVNGETLETPLSTQVEVTVVAPTLDAVDSLLIQTGTTGDLAETVMIGDEPADSWVIQWTAGDGTVVTAENGDLKGLKEGYTTVTGKLMQVNGTDVSHLNIVRTVDVTVRDDKVVDGYLNSYDYIVQKGSNLNDVYEILKHLQLTLEYSFSKDEVIQFASGVENGNYTGIMTVEGVGTLKIDLSGVDPTLTTNKNTIQTALVTFTDTTGEVFRDTIWIHVEGYDITQADGTVTLEEGITYELFTGSKIEPDREYIIVALGEDMALKNPDSTGTTTAEPMAQEVRITTADGKTTLTVNVSEAALVEWLIDTEVETAVSGRYQYNISNFLRYLSYGEDNLLIHGASLHAYMEPCNTANGEYYIIFTSGSSTYYLAYANGEWGITTTPTAVRLFQKHTEKTYDVPVNFDIIDPDQSKVTDENKADIVGATAGNPLLIPKGYDKTVGLQVLLNGEEVDLRDCTFLWEINSGSDYIKLDQEGNLMGVTEGNAKITVWLTHIDDSEVICNEHDVPHIERELYIRVVDDTVSGALVENTLTVGVGSQPDWSQVKLNIFLGGSTTPAYTVGYEDLDIRVADSDLNIHEPGKYTVTVNYQGTSYELTVVIDEDPYEGLEEAEKIPVYPDPGAVRIDKTAAGVNVFNESGVVKIDLTAAGVSTKSSVDVVLIVDVSNSMGWTDDWFKYSSYGTGEGQAAFPIAFDNTDESVTDYWMVYQKINTENPSKEAAWNDFISGKALTYYEETDDGAEYIWDDETGAYRKIKDGEVATHKLYSARAVADAEKVATDMEDTKLKAAMASAEEFAKILLDVEGNTLTFVTFAGNDDVHSPTRSEIDSVRTPFVALTDLEAAKAVFEGTHFNYITADKAKGSATYNLTIGAHSSSPDDKTSVTGTNRGNTNYDFAFGEAMDAVAAIKYQYEAENPGKSYDDSGRQLYVVFMTDGAPSHYNGKSTAGDYDLLWGTTENKKYTAGSYNVTTWLNAIDTYNELATDLNDEVSGIYAVGFDLDHGGFTGFEFAADSLGEVLEGVVQNTSLPVTLASDTEELKAYYSSLAKSLAYAGTSAKVTDEIGSDFTLFTNNQHHVSDVAGSDITITDEKVKALEDLNEITVTTYRLVVAADIGKTMTVINLDGSTSTVTLEEKHLGLRVQDDGDASTSEQTVLETVTFATDGSAAYSDLLGEYVNIMSTDSIGNVTITAVTFTYTKKLNQPVLDENGTQMTDENGQLMYETKETFVWNLGEIETLSMDNGDGISSEVKKPNGYITDREIVLSYYAYLEGSFNNPQKTDAALFDTNNFAYLEYIDANGDYVKMDYDVPQVAWQGAVITVKFFLVNEAGQYVNKANVAFNNVANRYIIPGHSAGYKVELNNQLEVLAYNALKDAGLDGEYNLYDTAAWAEILNNVDPDVVTKFEEDNDIRGGSVRDQDGKKDITDLIIITENSNNGTNVNVTIEFPVLIDESDLGESERPMAAMTVVMDYCKDFPIDVFTEGEKTGFTMMDGKLVYEDSDKTRYVMSAAGFAPYDATHDLREYVSGYSFSSTLKTANGSYSLINGDVDTITFTPSRFLEEVEKVFVAVRFEIYSPTFGENGSVTYPATTDNYYYMYKLVNIVPATVMYYETDGNVSSEFSYVGGWTDKETCTDELQDDYEMDSPIHDQVYGYDSSYSNDGQLSNDSSRFVEGSVTADQVVNDKPSTSASFVFTGTGFDLISRTGVDEATLRVHVTNQATGVRKIVSVINKGANELYQIPVISVKGLDYGTYKVEIMVYAAYSAEGLPDSLKEQMARDNDFHFDAIRIYDPVKGNAFAEDCYKHDGEYAQSIQQVGKLLVEQEAFQETTAQDGAVGTGAVYMDSHTISSGVEGVEGIDDTGFVKTTSVATYDKVGPNNEVYLAKGQGIAFALKSNGAIPASIQVGAKSITGAMVTLKAKIMNVDQVSNAQSHIAMVPKELKTSSAMYYVLASEAQLQTLFGDNDTVYVVVWNDNDNILSITDIKVSYGEEAFGTVELLYTQELADAAAYTISNSGNTLKRENDEWYYCDVNGDKIDKTGVVTLEAGGSWYVVDGKVDFTFSGLYQDQGSSKTYYIRNGRVEESLNGIARRDDQWLYFTNGVVDTSFTGIASYGDTGSWYVKEGVVQMDFSDAVTINNTTYTIQNGKVVS